MKKIFSIIADAYADASFVVRLLLFVLFVLPFIGGGALTRYLLIYKAGWNEEWTQTYVLYSLPWLLLFGVFIFLLSHFQKNN